MIGGSADKPFFTHGGVDEGFEAILTAYEQGGDGAVIMTNAEGGSELAEEVLRSIATEYAWPDWQPVVRTPVVVDPKILSGYVGTFHLGPNFEDVITLEDGHLAEQATGQAKFVLTPESQTKFFFTDIDAEIEFVRDAQGLVSYFVLHQDGQDHKAMRTK